MDPEPLFGKPVIEKVVRVNFEDVDLGFDVEEGDTYELEVVVELPPSSNEEGESRYTAMLETPACSVPSQGEYEAILGGDRARVIEAGSRGAFAKILASPPGSWALQLESRERGGRDLNMLFTFDELPEAGTAVHIQDASWTDAQVGGTVDRFDRERMASWNMGSIDISFDVVRSPAGKRFK